MRWLFPLGANIHSQTTFVRVALAATTSSLNKRPRGARPLGGRGFATSQLSGVGSSNHDGSHPQFDADTSSESLLGEELIRIT